MKTIKHRAAAVIFALLSGCLLNGCSKGLWVGVEPAKEEEYEAAKAEDGIYLAQTVHEPAEDPYADDTKAVSEGTTETGLVYKVYQQHVEITGHNGIILQEKLVIPDTIEGKPVTRIADINGNQGNSLELDESGGLYKCGRIVTVVLPDSLTEIGDYAFYGCTNLRTVEIPESVTRIGKRAFAMCENLSELNVPAAIGEIGESAFSMTPWYDNILYHRDLIIFNGRLYDTGRRCGSTVVIPDYVVEISAHAFFDCEAVQDVRIPASVEKIGERAFCSCNNLTTITIKNPECDIYNDPATISNRVKDNEYRFTGTIYCEADSTAEAYAKKYKRSYENG